MTTPVVLVPVHAVTHSYGTILGKPSSPANRKHAHTHITMCPGIHYAHTE